MLLFILVSITYIYLLVLFMSGGNLLANFKFSLQDFLIHISDCNIGDVDS